LRVPDIEGVSVLKNEYSRVLVFERVSDGENESVIVRGFESTRMCRFWRTQKLENAGKREGEFEQSRQRGFMQAGGC
jgi:hypothetical protein